MELGKSLLYLCAKIGAVIYCILPFIGLGYFFLGKLMEAFIVSVLFMVFDKYIEILGRSFE